MTFANSSSLRLDGTRYGRVMLEAVTASPVNPTKSFLERETPHSARLGAGWEFF